MIVRVLLFGCLLASPAYSDEMSGMPMDRQAMPGMTMTGAFGSYPMSRDASGTSWQPDLAEHHGIHGQRAIGC